MFYVILSSLFHLEYEFDDLIIDSLLYFFKMCFFCFMSLLNLLSSVHATNTATSNLALLMCLVIYVYPLSPVVCRVAAS